MAPKKQEPLSDGHIPTGATFVEVSITRAKNDRAIGLGFGVVMSPAEARALAKKLTDYAAVVEGER